jgi:hypothetical protein
MRSAAGDGLDLRGIEIDREPGGGRSRERGDEVGAANSAVRKYLPALALWNVVRVLQNMASSLFDSLYVPANQKVVISISKEGEYSDVCPRTRPG